MDKQNFTAVELAYVLERTKLPNGYRFHDFGDGATVVPCIMSADDPRFKTVIGIERILDGTSIILEAQS